MTNTILYECGICGCLHAWEWVGDCRDDAKRFASPEEYLEAIPLDDPRALEIRTMVERMDADEQEVRP